MTTEMKMIKIKAGLNSKNKTEANKELKITARKEGKYRSKSEKTTLLNRNCSTLAVKIKIIKIIITRGRSL
jgi:hypothetical protein